MYPLIIHNSPRYLIIKNSSYHSACLTAGNLSDGGSFKRGVFGIKLVTPYVGGVQRRLHAEPTNGRNSAPTHPHTPKHPHRLPQACLPGLHQLTHTTPRFTGRGSPWVRTSSILNAIFQRNICVLPCRASYMFFEVFTGTVRLLQKQTSFPSL